jgi:NitT/TauT family transport system permease protein
MPEEATPGLAKRYTVAVALLAAVWAVSLESLGSLIPFGRRFSGSALLELPYLDYATMVVLGGWSLLAFAAGFLAAAILLALIADLQRRAPQLGRLVALPLASLGAAPLLVFAPFVVMFFGLGVAAVAVVVFIVALCAATKTMVSAPPDEESAPAAAFDPFAIGGGEEADRSVALVVAAALRANVLYVLASGFFCEVLSGVGLGRLIYLAAMNTLDIATAMAAALIYALAGMAVVFALEASELALLRRSRT